jgi:hypothetical protein
MMNKLNVWRKIERFRKSGDLAKLSFFYKDFYNFAILPLFPFLHRKSFSSTPLIKATESHYIPFFKIELLLEYAAIQLTIS